MSKLVLWQSRPVADSVVKDAIQGTELGRRAECGAPVVVAGRLVEHYSPNLRRGTDLSSYQEQNDARECIRNKVSYLP